ncbi:MAG: type II toxin-antitoxin system RelE/ParE family toxin [Prevotella sp.]|nr:type II toxin-antitoxin system RelE/ParE family toxin [Prevotella sp.]MDE6354934.1 type II toxin-antitoxin system RelE/ParE family toxin [Prevotella sp.]
MRYEIELGRQFKKNFKRLIKKYKSIDKDLENLIEQLENNPYTGTDLGGGVRKIRMAISDKAKGKSHGARIITYTVTVDETSGTVTLLTIYDKEDLETITAREIAMLLNEIDIE